MDQAWLTAFLKSAGYPDRAELIAELFPETQSQPAESLPLDLIPDPAPLPPHSIMPLSKNPFFVGRQEDLLALATALNAEGTAAVSQVETAAATGLGGIGKTQLACEFVHRYGQFFPGGVFWLSFDNAESVPAEVAGCGGVGALELRPNFEQLSLQEQVDLVQAAWREPVPRLLVFDNCEALDLLTEWRPTSGGCRIVITSRRGDWEPTLGVQMLALGVLSRDESLALLRSYTSETDDEISDEILNAIAEELGDLPLALHLAGSHLRRYPHVAPHAYLEQLRDPHLLHHPSMQGEGFSPTGHVQHVGRTFALSYDRLDPDDETDASAIKLLVHAAHFAPGEPIWYRLLVKTLGLDLDDPDEAFQADAAFARLIELGIIEREENDTLRMHRLVARFVRDVAKEQVEATQKVVEAVVFEETASVNREVRPMPLLAWQLHLRSVADIAQVREDEESARLCHELGLHLLQIGDFEGALRYAEKALAIRDQMGSCPNLSRAESLTLIGRILRPLGRGAETFDYFDQALSIRLDHQRAHPKLVAESMNDLGHFYYAEGNFEDARSYFEKAIHIDMDTSEDAFVAELNNNLGMCLRKLEQPEQALQYLHHARAINERKWGEEHPHTALNLNNIGSLLLNLKRYDEALDFVERGLAIRQAAYGPSHHDTGQSFSLRGWVLLRLGEYTLAKESIEAALDIYRQTFDLAHPIYAECFNALGLIMQAQGEFKMAQEWLENAVTLRRKSLGSDHPLTNESRRYLDSVLNERSY